MLAQKRQGVLVVSTNYGKGIVIQFYRGLVYKSTFRLAATITALASVLLRARG